MRKLFQLDPKVCSAMTCCFLALVASLVIGLLGVCLTSIFAKSPKKSGGYKANFPLFLQNLVFYCLGSAVVMIGILIQCIGVLGAAARCICRGGVSDFFQICCNQGRYRSSLKARCDDVLRVLTVVGASTFFALETPLFSSYFLLTQLDSVAQGLLQFNATIPIPEDIINIASEFEGNLSSDLNNCIYFGMIPVVITMIIFGVSATIRMCCCSSEGLGGISDGQENEDQASNEDDESVDEETGLLEHPIGYQASI